MVHAIWFYMIDCYTLLLVPLLLYYFCINVVLLILSCLKKYFSSYNFFLIFTTFHSFPCPFYYIHCLVHSTVFFNYLKLLIIFPKYFKLFPYPVILSQILLNYQLNQHIAVNLHNCLLFRRSVLKCCG